MPRRFLPALLIGLTLSAQLPERPGSVERDQENMRLPNGKLQRDEILKAEHAKSLADAATLVQLSGELQAELDKAGSYVVSVQTIKKTEEIERLAKRIRSRLKRG